MLKRIFAFSLISLILLANMSCYKNEKAKEISLEKIEAVKLKEKQPEKNQLRIAVGSMITPREGFAYYKQLLDYVGKN